LPMRNYILAEIKRHPSVHPRDIVKLCYQAARGGEHLLKDQEIARTYFNSEYDNVAVDDRPLYELISDDLCRVNLSAWKRNGLPREWLFGMFLKSAEGFGKSDVSLEQCLEEAFHALFEADSDKGTAGFSKDDFMTYTSEYLKAGCPSVHHSPEYRAEEKPAYRIVHRRYLRMIPVLMKLSEIVLGKSGIVNLPIVIAIDGRAASGKSTMAEMLAGLLEAEIIRMDDFFLPMDLRCEKRYAEPGGNVHYERFCEEVLPYIHEKTAFSYGVFDCSLMQVTNRKEIRSIIESEYPIRIVEGSYSCHPMFGRYADLALFSDITSEEQLHRIEKRDGPFLAERFRREWIPMEELYFDTYKIRETVDLIC